MLSSPVNSPYTKNAWNSQGILGVFPQRKGTDIEGGKDNHLVDHTYEIKEVFARKNGWR